MIEYSHKLKRGIQKWYISLVKMATPPVQKSEYERDAISICKKLLSKEDTILFFTPISNKRYLRNEESEIFLILLYNHIFHQQSSGIFHDLEDHICHESYFLHV